MIEFQFQESNWEVPAILRSQSIGPLESDRRLIIHLKIDYKITIMKKTLFKMIICFEIVVVRFFVLFIFLQLQHKMREHHQMEICENYNFHCGHKFPYVHHENFRKYRNEKIHRDRDLLALQWRESESHKVQEKVRQTKLISFHQRNMKFFLHINLQQFDR